MSSKYWSEAESRAVIEAWRRSGESGPAFARRHRLRPNGIKYWAGRPWRFFLEGPWLDPSVYVSSGYRDVLVRKWRRQEREGMTAEQIAGVRAEQADNVRAYADGQLPSWLLDESVNEAALLDVPEISIRWLVSPSELERSGRCSPARTTRNLTLTTRRRSSTHERGRVHRSRTGRDPDVGRDLLRETATGAIAFPNAPFGVALDESPLLRHL